MRVLGINKKEKKRKRQETIENKINEHHITNGKMRIINISSCKKNQLHRSRIVSLPNKA